MADEIDKLEEALGLLAHTFNRPKAWENLQREADIKIDRPSAYLLHVLSYTNSGYTISELASKLGIEPPSVTRSVQQMERNGLVRRAVDPDDRRSFRIRATKEGHRVMSRVQMAKRKRLTSMVANWSQNDRRKLAQLLHRLSKEAPTMTKITKEKLSK